MYLLHETRSSIVGTSKGLLVSLFVDLQKSASHTHFLCHLEIGIWTLLFKSSISRNRYQQVHNPSFLFSEACADRLRISRFCHDLRLIPSIHPLPQSARSVPSKFPSPLNQPNFTNQIFTNPRLDNTRCSINSTSGN